MKVFKKTKQRKCKKKIFGFDVETYGQYNKFKMGSIYYDNNNYWTFWNKREMIDFIFKSPIMYNSIIAATNLAFDFDTLLFNEPEGEFVNVCRRNSDIICAETFVNKKGIYLKRDKEDMRYNIKFIDTLNYAHLSVEKIGKMLKMPKHKKPLKLGHENLTKKQEIELEAYNIQDSKISKYFIEYIKDFIEEQGGTFKDTISQSAMSMFRCKFLTKEYFQPPKEVIDEQFNAYFGGRTECFERGYVENYHYYDINSMYPHVMENMEYPDPNTWRRRKRGSIENIYKYHGISNIIVYVPEYLMYPILPLRTKDKLLFPVGIFSTWATHIEIREAIKQRAKVLIIQEQQYFKETCRPFTNYINHFFQLKQQYELNPAKRQIIKLFLNSLYGKFGQTLLNKTKMIHDSKVTYEMIEKAINIDRSGSFFIMDSDRIEHPVFVIPIWALHVTAYARLHLYKYINKYKPIYCDTDSIVTNQEIPTSELLGDMKLEAFIDKGIFIRPKFYGFRDKLKSYVKIKGVTNQFDYNGFETFLLNPITKYKKFAKFKESIRRGFEPNEIIDCIKELSLNDAKREWSEQINLKILKKSAPINVS